MSMGKLWVVFHTKIQQMSTGTGWTNESVLVKKYDSPDEAQDWADCLNLAGTHFDHEKVKLPENHTIIVRDFNSGEIYEPPPYTANKWIAERSQRKVTQKCPHCENQMEYPVFAAGDRVSPKNGATVDSASRYPNDDENKLTPGQTYLVTGFIPPITCKQVAGVYVEDKFGLFNCNKLKRPR